MIWSHMKYFPDALRLDEHICPGKPCILRRANLAVLRRKPQPVVCGASYKQSTKHQYKIKLRLRRYYCGIPQAHGDGAVDASLDDRNNAENIVDRRAEDGFFDGKAYRLVPVEGGEHTILINGVKMHISMGKLPSQDAEDKARIVKVRRGSTVLDVCCGLGYSAIACARLGARRVVTLELDPCVLEVARQNPQSAELFDSGGVIDILLGPAQETVTTLPDEAFSAVLHDPPRISHAGELYSQAFYDQIFRVLKCGGRFFHYTGNPGSRSSIPKGVKERLIKSGFVNVKWIDKCQGLLAVKP
ncbi:hypothetical protein VaNZ11_000289 [Volvox africanus]|uniref:Methyltransferase domain-containing protein n=1 Tax=Volvox africanus TaxID=51714 RepID=A0ABQ5RLP2_9CHLO|nr:hypothetical protein VaNZ11_000289 [Volvox africanus]